MRRSNQPQPGRISPLERGGELLVVFFGGAVEVGDLAGAGAEGAAGHLHEPDWGVGFFVEPHMRASRLVEAFEQHGVRIEHADCQRWMRCRRSRSATWTPIEVERAAARLWAAHTALLGQNIRVIGLC